MNGDRPMRWDLMQKRSLAVGLIAAVLCAGGALIFPPSFFRAYLSAYIFGLGFRWDAWRCSCCIISWAGDGVL